MIRLGIAVVRGASMQPTLRTGDRLLVGYGLRAAAGDLVVVRLPGGRPVSVKRLRHREPDGFWVERDNPWVGVDSWQVGAVASDDLLAVVLARLWPHPRPFMPRRFGRMWHNRRHG